MLTLPARPEGRPSNARLQLENVTLRAEVDRLAEERAELDMELHAHVTERLRFAAEVLALSRHGQLLIAAGHRPAQALHDLEARALREQLRAHTGGIE